MGIDPLEESARPYPDGEVWATPSKDVGHRGAVCLGFERMSLSLAQFRSGGVGSEAWHDISYPLGERPLPRIRGASLYLAPFGPGSPPSEDDHGMKHVDPRGFGSLR